jgi:hypothetical protein
MKSPMTKITLLSRDQQTVLGVISVPQTYEPYQVIVWQQDPFIPTAGRKNVYHEAVSFQATGTC